jgi:DNA-binding response OmpR family regulator
MSSVEIRAFPPQLVEAVKPYLGRSMAMTKTVLVVDDDQDTVDILQLYLEHEGYRSVVAYDGQEALKSVKEFDPDLIILDLMLPIVGGFQVCRHIRAESLVPIVILTARLDEESRRAGAEVGAQDYITKPFSPKEVVSRVHAILEVNNALN